MNRGWLLVVIGVLISSFLGGAIRVTFSPERMRAFVEDVAAKKEPKFNFSFGSAQLLLHESWRPAVAVDLHDVKIRAKDPCVTSSLLFVKRLTLPLNFLALWQKRVRFARIHADNVRLDYQAAACTPNPDAAADSTVSKDFWSPLEKFFRERWDKEVANSKRYFDRFNVEHFEFFHNSDSPVFTVDEFALDFADTEGQLRFKFTPGYRLTAAEPFGPMITEVTLRADRMEFFSRGNLKEGQIRIEGEWTVNDGHLQLSHEFRDVRLNHLIRLAQYWDLFPPLPFGFRNAWAKCRIDYSGDIRSITRDPMKFSGCEIYGDIGSAVLETASLKLSEIYPVNIRLNPSPLRDTLESIGLARRFGLVRQFGTFAGHMRVDGPSQFKMDGEIQGVQIVSSSDPINGNFTVSYAPDEEFKLKVATDAVTNEFFDVTGIQFQMQPAEGRWVITPSIKKLAIKPKAVWFALSSQLSSSLKVRQDAISYENIGGQVVWREGILRWDQLNGRIGGLDARIDSAGEWKVDGSVSGWVNLESASRSLSPRRWDISGLIQQPVLKAAATP